MNYPAKEDLSLKLNRTIKSICLFALLGLSESNAQEYAFRSFTVNDGLVSNYVTTVKQDSKGYLWIGTDDGFSIFDGKNFLNINPQKEPRWGHINSFEESAIDQDVMWVATNGGGVLKYSKGNYKNILIDTNLAANRVNDLCEGSDGTLWCTTDNGLYRVSEQGSEHIDLPTKNIKEISQVVFIDDDHLWITYSFGVISFSTKTRESQEILSAEMQGTNGQLVVFPSGRTKAVITTHAVYIYSNGTFKKAVSISNELLGNGTHNGTDNLWAAAAQCVYQFKNIRGSFRTVNTFDARNGMPVNDVSAITSDRENNIWFGTAGKGIVRLQDPENYRFRFDGLTSRGTNDVQGRMWVPSTNGLTILEHQRNNRWKTIHRTFAPAENPIALQISSDTLWCTTIRRDLKAYRITRSSKGETGVERIVTLDRRNGLPFIYTFVLFKDSRGFLWCGKDVEGVVVISTRGKPSVEKIFSRFQGVTPMTISAFTETPDGHIFAGGNGSNALLEFEFHNGSYRFVNAHRFDSIISPYGIRSLATTPDGSLWIGTRYDGIIRRYPNGTIRHITQNDGLHSMQVLSLLSNGKSLWIGTQSGMEYVPDFDSPRFFVNTELTRSPVYTIGRYDHRTIWGMSRYELIMNDTRTIETPQILPPIYLSRFDVNGVSQPRSAVPEISGSELISCSFTYTCVTLKGNIDVQYQYQLEGLHERWQNLTQERSVTFVNLGAGRYTFRVRAVLNNGEQITDTVSQSFIVVPPLWDRWWFTPLLSLFFFSIILAIVALRIRQQVVLEKIRVSIAADLHDEIGSALARIANLADILVMHQSTQPARRMRALSTTEEIVPLTNPTKIASLSRELLEKMSDVVWSVNPHNDDLKKLLDRVQTYTTEVAESHYLQLHYVVHGNSRSRRIDPQTSRATLLIMKEALSNILIHAQATTVRVTVEISERLLTIRIHDNGIGFTENELPRVNGIYNMRNRAKLCGGSITINSTLKNGTELLLHLPV